MHGVDLRSQGLSLQSGKRVQYASPLTIRQVTQCPECNLHDIIATNTADFFNLLRVFQHYNG